MSPSFLAPHRSPRSTLFPYTHALPISSDVRRAAITSGRSASAIMRNSACVWLIGPSSNWNSMSSGASSVGRSEEHTSELQSLRHVVWRLLLENRKQAHYIYAQYEKSKY